MVQEEGNKIMNVPQPTQLQLAVSDSGFFSEVIIPGPPLYI